MVRDKKKPSPYSKMYLVTPMVYEKLKNCLNKIDQVDMINLNKKYQPLSKDKSDIGIQNLSKQEFKRSDDDDDDNKKPDLNKKQNQNGKKDNSNSTTDSISRSQSPKPGPSTSKKSSPYDDNEFQQNFDLSQNYLDDFGESEMYFDDNNYEDIDFDSNQFSNIPKTQDFQQQFSSKKQDFQQQTEPEFENMETYPVSLNRDTSTQTFYSDDYQDTSTSRRSPQKSITFKKPKPLKHQINLRNIPISYVNDITTVAKPPIRTISTEMQTEPMTIYQDTSSSRSPKKSLTFRKPKALKYQRNLKHIPISYVNNITTVAKPPTRTVSTEIQTEPMSSEMQMDQTPSIEMVYRKPLELVDKRNFPALTDQTKKTSLNKKNFLKLQQQYKKSIGYKPKQNFDRRIALPSGSRHRELPHLGKKGFLKYQCDVCGKWFTRKYGLQRHKKTFHRSKNTMAVVPKSRNNVSIVEYIPNDNSSYQIEHSDSIPITYEPDSDISDVGNENTILPITYEEENQTEPEPSTSMDVDKLQFAGFKRNLKSQLPRPQKIQRAKVPSNKDMKDKETIKKATEFEHWKLL